MDSDNTEPAISRLPVEILAACFLWCIDIEGPLPTYDPDRSPVKLTAICRSWRAVALSTPRLWARLHFKASCLESRAPEELAKLSLFLERSRAAPLTYTVDFGNSDEDYLPTESFDSLRRIIKLLVRHASHWYDMILQDLQDSHHYPDTMTVTGDMSFPLLRQLSCWGLYEGIKQLAFTAERAPSLECVTLSILQARTWSVPFSQLRSLFILDWYGQEASLPEILDVLSQCPRLCDLRIESDRNEPAHQSSGREVELRTLTYFSLKTDLDQPSVILGALSAPALVHLCINVWQGSVDDLVSFLSRHSATIRALDLAIWYGTKVNAICTSLPNLKNLTLQCNVVQVAIVVDDLLRHHSGRSPSHPAATLPKAIHLEALTLAIRFDKESQYVKETSHDLVAPLLSLIEDWGHDVHTHDPSSDNVSISSLQCAPTFKLHLRLGLKCTKRQSLHDNVRTWGRSIRGALGPLLEQERVPFTYEFVEENMVLKEQPREGRVSVYHTSTFHRRLAHAEELAGLPGPATDSD